MTDLNYNGVLPYLKTGSVKRTWEVEANLPISFQIKYSANIFDPDNLDLLELGQSNRRFIAVDEVVYDLYEEEILTYFEANQISHVIHKIPSSESRKDFDNLESLLREVEEFGLLRRSEPILAIGGGVLLDIVGFAASIYRRGVPYIRVPTTLLALIDASVGAKTAINHFDRRNRLGSYYPPEVAYLDRKFIESQSQREISNGLAEIFKLALIKDEELFKLLEVSADELIRERFQFGAVPVRVINRAIGGMVDELSPNLWEKKLDRCVDFGHSFSPLIEMTALPDLLHGEAVCLDCLFSCCIALRRDLLKMEDLDRIFDTARALQLPTKHPLFSKPKLLQESLIETTRHRNGNQYLPLPCGIGSYVFCNDLSYNEIEMAAELMETKG